MDDPNIEELYGSTPEISFSVGGWEVDKQELEQDTEDESSLYDQYADSVSKAKSIIGFNFKLTFPSVKDNRTSISGIFFTGRPYVVTIKKASYLEMKGFLKEKWATEFGCLPSLYQDWLTSKEYENDSPQNGTTTATSYTDFILQHKEDFFKKHIELIVHAKKNSLSDQSEDYSSELELIELRELASACIFIIDVWLKRKSPNTSDSTETRVTLTLPSLRHNSIRDLSLEKLSQPSIMEDSLQSIIDTLYDYIK